MRILETKHGRASRKNRRAKRQRKTLDQLIEFANTGYRFRSDRREFLYKTDVPVTTYHSEISNAINQAKHVGYCQLLLSDCVGLEATYPNYHNQVDLPKQHLFEDDDNVLPFRNISLFEYTAPRIAPYGTFPLDDETCFDLIAGNIFITGLLNLENLKKRYENFGLDLELPELRSWNTLSSDSEKKNFLESIRFVVNDGERFIGLTLFNLVRICAEFINEDTIIKTNVRLLNLIKELKIPPDKISSFYIGHINEEEIWV